MGPYGVAKRATGEMNLPDKPFRLAADQIAPLIDDPGACLATDRITVEGSRVGYMYREEPDGSWDSGWRFTAGDEPDVYLENPAHMELYSLNTIANYDPEIIPFLSAPVGSAFERENGRGPFVAAPPPSLED